MQRSNLVNDSGSFVGGAGGRHSLNYCDVISIPNLFTAWRKFSRGKRSNDDVAKFELSLENNLFKLHMDLSDDTWEPDPYEIFHVNDVKPRKIHEATVRDRVLYQAVHQRLYQIFDPHFIHDSYSSRDFKGTHRGVKRLEEFARKVTANYSQNGYVLKCDIKRFFDSIDHQILFSLMHKKISDPLLLGLIKKTIESFETSSGKGLPLGNVTSQLFANIYLNELDQFAKHTLKAEYYIRYCDDFVIVHQSREHLEYCIKQIQNFCETKFLINLHPHKVTIRKIVSGCDFLGYVSMPHYRRLRTNTRRRI